MEDSNQGPYQDSPPCTPMTANTPPSIKASTSAPNAVPDSPEAVYHEETLANPEYANLPSPQPQRYHANPNHGQRSYYPPYTDARNSGDSEDDVPLAHLYPSYPSEAPPPYADVVTQSYRATLISHIPSNSLTVSADSDSEAGVEREYPDDDGRYTAERLMALLILVIFLLLVSSMLVSFVIFWRPFGGKI